MDVNAEKLKALRTEFAQLAGDFHDQMNLISNQVKLIKTSSDKLVELTLQLDKLCIDNPLRVAEQKPANLPHFLDETPKFPGSSFLTRGHHDLSSTFYAPPPQTPSHDFFSSYQSPALSASVSPTTFAYSEEYNNQVRIELRRTVEFSGGAAGGVGAAGGGGSSAGVSDPGTSAAGTSVPGVSAASGGGGGTVHASESTFLAPLPKKVAAKSASEFFRAKLNENFVKIATAALDKYRQYGTLRATREGREYYFTPLVSDFIRDLIRKYQVDNNLTNCIPKKPKAGAPTFEELLYMVPGIEPTTVVRMRDGKNTTVPAFFYKVS